MEGRGKIETEMERRSLCCICRFDGSTGEVSNLVARHRQDKVESIKIHILCPVDLLCKKEAQYKSLLFKMENDKSNREDKIGGKTLAIKRLM
jgi:hypothetical protein